MLKGLRRLILRGVKQVSREQQRQGRKLVKALLAPAAKPRRSKVAAHNAAAPPKPRAQRKSAARPAIVQPTQRLQGHWLTSYFTSATHGLTEPARRMTYWLYLPKLEVAGELPLVVLLHGCDQTADEFARSTRMNHLADEKGFAVLYPQQSIKGHPQRCWPWYEQSVQDGGEEVGLIAGCIDKVLQQYPFDRSRIYIAGLSAGAAMAHILALTFPQGFAAVGLHSGPVFGAGHSRMGAYAVMQGGSLQASIHALDRFGPLPAMPAILLQGEADRVVRTINQSQLASQFRTLNHLGPDSAVPVVRKAANRNRAGCRIEDYRLGRKLLLRVCNIDGLGHAWSGGDDTLKYTEGKGPDASAMMWDFFARHKRRDSKPASTVI